MKNSCPALVEQSSGSVSDTTSRYKWSFQPAGSDKRLSFYCLLVFNKVPIKKKKRYQLIQVVHNALKAKDVVARSILITHQCFSRRKVLVIIPEKAMEILCFSSYINLALEWKSKCYLLSRVWLFVTPWTVASQVPLSTGFSWQELWSGLPFPSPRDLPNPGMKPRSPALQADSLLSEPPGKPLFWNK